MQSQRLRWLVNAQGPFVSVYFDDSHDTADAIEHLQTTWQDIRKELEARGAGDDVVATREEAVLRFRPAVGRRGRAVIATADQVLVNEHLTSPPPAMEVRVSDYPYVVPLVEFEMQRPTYVFAAVDHTGADITLYQGGSVAATSIEGGGFPVHNPVSAGWKGYGDHQHTTEEAIRMNCREVADALTRLVDEADPEVVFLCGEVSSLADLGAELPERVANRVSQLHAGARKSGIDEEQVRELTAAEFTRRRGIEIAGFVERFEAETGRGSGLAAEGLAAVCAALRDGDVDTLIVGEVGDETVVTGEALITIAPNADALSELGEPVRRVARADEALPFAAIAVGAALVRADGRISPADGVGALLRYAATDRLAGQR
ncbi:Rv2629 family ribosome hibernation factor [Mycobacterium sp. 050134]|uniref:Rv2629 family ribosome hibernation factor n=1 Tax=Mycobacterium sp. 050134 TaxID=3096111 RepID=UPI002ED7B1DF